jgi:hypothetical protein
MINFVFGSPGGGKSLFGMRLIADELANGNRWVVTNIPVRVAEFADYLHQGRGAAVDVAGRLRVLTDEETARFWLYAGPGRETTARVPFKAGELTVTVPDYGERAAAAFGTLYVIDEVHSFFNARAWQKVAFDAQFFLSQHRKLGCDVVLVTQHPEQVDKNFRRLAQDFTRLRNLGNERVAGFTARGVFRWATYLLLPSAGGISHPMATGFFKLDVSGLAGCYDTNAGVGVGGRTNTVETRARGFPLKVLFGAGVVMVVGLIFLPKAVTSSMGWVFGRIVGAGGKLAAVVKPAVPGKGVVSEGRGGDQSASERIVERSSELVAGTNLHITLQRVDGLGRGMRWWLSDNRVVTADTPGFRFGGPECVMVGTERYWRPLNVTNRGPVLFLVSTNWGR